MAQFDINRVLMESPSKIAELAEKAEESRFLLDCAKLNLEQAEARLHLETKAQNEDMTQSDIKATVNASDEIYEKKMEVITMESAFKKAEIECDKWRDAYISARKLAGLKIAELGSISDGVRGKGRE
jgi:hypothetical protein